MSKKGRKIGKEEKFDVKFSKQAENQSFYLGIFSLRGSLNFFRLARFFRQVHGSPAKKFENPCNKVSILKCKRETLGFVVVVVAKHFSSIFQALSRVFVLHKRVSLESSQIFQNKAVFSILVLLERMHV
jgi:hypothetical protein